MSARFLAALALIGAMSLAQAAPTHKARPKPAPTSKPSPVAQLCHPLAQMHAMVAQLGGGDWVQLSADQLDFVRDLYVAMPPPSGPPKGGIAFMAPVPGPLGAIIIFSDGEQSCSNIAGMFPVFLERLIDLGGKDGL